MITILVNHHKEILYKVFDSKKGPDNDDVYATYHSMLCTYPYFKDYQFLDIYLNEPRKDGQIRNWEFLES